MPRRLAPAAALLALAGCSLGPAYAPPPLPPAPGLQDGRFLRAAQPADAAGPVARWWEALGDATLSGLIERGLAGAPAIAAAQARLRQARESVAAARAAALPAAGASAIYARAELPANSLGAGNSGIDLFNLGFDAQWEVDLWGGQRSSRAKALAQMEGAAARLADAQVALAAEIARTYVALRASEASLALAEQRSAGDAESVTLARLRLRGGTVPASVLAAARLQQASGLQERDRIAAETIVLRDALAALLGEAPGTLDTLAPGPVPLPPPALAIGDPAAMLQRRPDIRAAERRLAAATAQIGVSRARQFPQISLMGLIGLGGTSAGDILDTSQVSALALPRLNWSFLDMGRAAAARRADEAARDEALADYRSAIIAALQDAEAALARFGAARSGLAQAEEIARNAAAIADQQARRARAGTAARPDQLDAERRALDARLGAVKSRAEATSAFIALSKALGLGWTPAGAP